MSKSKNGNLTSTEFEKCILFILVIYHCDAMVRGNNHIDVRAKTFVATNQPRKLLHKCWAHKIPVPVPNMEI